MEIKKRPTAALIGGAILAWQLVLQPIWNLNIERLAEQNKLDTTLSGGGIMNSISSIFSFLPSSFATGFAFGALIFAYWDWLALQFKRKFRPEAEQNRIRAWAANYAPSINKERGTISIWIQVVGIGDVPFRIAGVEGSIGLKANDGNDKRLSFVLDDVRFGTKPAEEYVQRGFLASFAIEMNAPRAFLRLMPDVMFWRPYPSLDFEHLTIWIESKNGVKKRLPLWDSMRMSSGEWEICGVETRKVFKTPEERETFKNAMDTLSTFISKRS